MRTNTTTLTFASLCLAGTTAAVLLAGCGGDDAKTVGCAFFSGDNCWKETVAAAYKCVDGTATGMYDAQRTECSFSDGTIIKFATPVPESFLDYEFDFDVLSPGGDTCASFQEFEAGVEVETSLGVFRQDVVGSDVVISCPDGGEFEIGAFTSFECEIGSLPGFAAGGSGGSISLSLTTANETWFSCADIVLNP